MRKILLLIMTGLLVTTLSAGAAWAKPDNAVKTKAKEKVSTMQMYKARYKETVKAVATQKSFKFKDIDNHWANGSIQRMAMLGLFAGYNDGTFKPENNISQAEMIALLMRLVDTDSDDDEDANVNEDELDKVPVWARNAIRNAAKLKIMSLNRFHSAEQASRAQTCIVIGKILEKEGYLDPDDFKIDPDDLPFADGELLLNNNDLVYILAMYRAGYIKGAPGNKFLPNNAITRAEMAAILERILADLEKEDDGEDELAGDCFYVDDIEFKITSINYDKDYDEILVYLKASEDNASSKWNALDSDDIEDGVEDICEEITKVFQDDTEAEPVMTYISFYDQNSRLLGSYVYDVDDESLD